jgi:hypothetical protein
MGLCPVTGNREKTERLGKPHGTIVSPEVYRDMKQVQPPATPPEITPYMAGQCIMTTGRLRAFLGSEYEAVMQHNVEEAFVESLAGVVPGVAAAQAVAGYAIFFATS